MQPIFPTKVGHSHSQQKLGTARGAPLIAQVTAVHAFVTMSGTHGCVFLIKSLRCKNRLPRAAVMVRTPLFLFLPR